MASSEVGQATIKLTFDTKSLSKSQGEVEAKMTTVGSESGSKWANAWSVAAGNIIAKGIEKVTAAISSHLDDAVKRVDTLNNFPKVMLNMGIAAGDSARVISDLGEKLTGLPTTLDAAALSVQRFTSKNGDVEKSEKIFLAVNDAILAGGASAELQSSALEQLAQAYAKGKPDMMEWRTIQQAMPAQLKQVAQAMLGSADSLDAWIAKANQFAKDNPLNSTAKELVEQLEAVKNGSGDMTTALGTALRSGIISMDEFTDTLIKMDTAGVDGFASLADQAKDATQGIGTSMRNLNTAVVKAITDVFQTIGQARIAGAIQGIINVIGKISKVVSGIVKVIMSVIDSLASSFSWLGTVFDGVIAVLQGIGDMFSWLADQKGVVDLLKNIAIAIGVMVTAWKGYQLVAGVVQGIQLALNSAMVAGTAATGAYATGIGLVSTAQNVCATAGKALNAVFSTTSIVALGIVAVFEAIQVATEAMKLATMEADLAEKNRMDTIKMSTKTTEWHNEALEEQKRLLDELENAELSAVDAELAYINAQETATEKQNKYNQMVQAGTYSAEELHKAELEMLSAEGRVTEAKNKLAEAQGNVNNTLTEYDNQEWKRIATEKQAELLELEKAGRYDEIEQKLQELSNSTIKYTDAYGNAMEFTKEDTQEMAQFIGDQLAKADDNFKNHWLSTKNGIVSVTTEALEATKLKTGEFYQIGANLMLGLKKGIEKTKNNVLEASRDVVAATIAAAKQVGEIHSPSRVFQRIGYFLDKGLELGIRNNSGLPADAAGYMMEQVSGVSTNSPTISSPSVTDHSGMLDTVISSSASAATAETGRPVNVTINNQINNELDARNIDQVMAQAMRRAAI